MYFQAWRGYFDLLGRAPRSEYWSFMLINIAIAAVLVFGWFQSIDSFDDLFAPNGFLIALTLFVLAQLIPNIMVTIRRVRDATGSGWWVLLNFIPVIGNLVVFVITLMPSKQDY